MSDSVRLHGRQLDPLACGLCLASSMGAPWRGWRAVLVHSGCMVATECGLQTDGVLRHVRWQHGGGVLAHARSIQWGGVLGHAKSTQGGSVLRHTCSEHARR